MGQKGFFDVERRLEAISAKGDPLETIKKIVPWEDFRADIEAVTEAKPEERKSNAGRKPYDTILKFKIMVLQSLHNLSDDRTEYLIRDRISFMRFLDLELEDPVPDATTIWLFREALAQAGLIDNLFERFGQHIEAEGYIARGGQPSRMVIVCVMSVPHISLTLSVVIVPSCGLAAVRPTRCGASKPVSRITRRTRRGLARTPAKRNRAHNLRVAFPVKAEASICRRI